jgi:threonine dehydrogenase-like Zn-dependent dehydrogenase
MQKFTLVAPETFIKDNVPEPEIKDGEALIEIKSMGICAGDIRQYIGKRTDIRPFPIVRCHEFGGIVEKIKGGTGKIKVGDKVAVSPHINCGDCYYCNSGLELACDNDKLFGVNIDGALAEKIKVPIDKLAKLSDDFDIKYSSLIEPATVAYNIVKEARNANVMIIGVGAIGIMAVPIAKYFGNKVIAVDIDDDHLKIAKDLGADLVLNFKDEDKDGKLEGSFGIERIKYIAITYLNQQVLDWSLKVLQKCGTVTIIDIPPDPLYNVDFRKLWKKIITIKNLDSFYYKDFKEAAELVDKGVIDFDKVVSKIFPLDKIKEAFDYKINNNALKVLLTR